MEKDKGEITNQIKLVKRKSIYQKSSFFMFPKSEYLVNLIFNKLKTYKAKEIFLEKEELKKFISSLIKEN